jgi:putative endopeptidase
MKQFIFTISALSLVLSSCNTLKNNSKDDKGSSKGFKTIDQSYLDKGVRPQEDFFMFANGSWIKKNPVPPSESRWGSFNELEQNNKIKLTAILKECVANPGKPGSDAHILGQYYASYIDMDTRNQLGFAPIKAEIAAIRQLKSKEELLPLIAQQHMYGIGSFFSFGVGQDLKNVDKNITYIGQGGISLPNKDYYSAENKKEIREKFMEYMKSIFELAGYSADEATKMSYLVLKFETQMAESMMTPAELRVPENTYTKYSMDGCAQLLAPLHFKIYLSEVKSQSFDSIVVSQPEYLKNLGKLIESSDISTLRTYMLWKTLNHYAGCLDQQFVDARFSFYGKVLSGKSEMKPITERAIDEITNKEFGEILGKEFVKRHFSEDSQKRVNLMVDNLLIVFQERIKNLDWMTEATKSEAINKLNSIGRKLGFPSKWENFTELVFDKAKYVENVKLENLYAHLKNMKELYLPVDKEKWGMPAHMVNAYYHPLLNEIAFPAGIMQAPFFDENAEDAVNYGRIGMVIGHEFTHGFDDMGSKFAADGSFKNWWSDADLSAFQEKTGILGETFAAFCPIEGHCVNPDLTMGENIADLGGLTMAFYAYARTEEFQSGVSRDGFTPAQRFFIAYAQLWKINYTEAELKNRIANDPHSPGMYRVNGPLMNCPEFFKAFEVNEGDKMRNPEGKVARIW